MAEETIQENTVNIDMNNAEEVITELSGEQIFDDDLAFIKTSLFISNQLKKHTANVPTYSPKTFNEQIVFYHNGATIRLYIWMNSAWRYIALT